MCPHPWPSAAYLKACPGSFALRIATGRTPFQSLTSVLIYCGPAGPGQRKGQAMRMYSWATWEGIGEGLVAPHWLAWAPDASALALGYADALLLCRTQPAFGAVASLPLQVGCYALSFACSAF